MFPILYLSWFLVWYLVLDVKPASGGYRWMQGPSGLKKIGRVPHVCSFAPYVFCCNTNSYSYMLDSLHHFCVKASEISTIGHKKQSKYYMRIWVNRNELCWNIGVSLYAIYQLWIRLVYINNIVLNWMIISSIDYKTSQTGKRKKKTCEGNYLFRT